MSQPTPPEDIPKDIINRLQQQSPARLEEIASYALSLSESKTEEVEAKIETDSVDIEESPDEWDEQEWKEKMDDADAPAKATLTTKTIDGRDYYYYQWREGGSIKSEYIAPVVPAN